MAKMIKDTNNICYVIEDKFNDLLNKGNVKNRTLQSMNSVTKKQYCSSTQQLIANGLFMRKH